jgi:hypothetical protein
LKPILRRVYAPRGQQPVVKVNHRFEWLYIVAFVHPRSGQNIWYLLPVLNTLAFQAVLDDFALSVLEHSGSKHILLVLDQAGWHTSKDLMVPQGITLVFQPSHSPEVQPCERLWVLTDEVIENRCFAHLAEVESCLFRQCEVLMADPIRVRNQTLFAWWDCLGK